MDSYKDLYFFLFSGVSNFIEPWSPISTEGAIAKQTLQELLNTAEERYLAAEL